MFDQKARLRLMLLCFLSSEPAAIAHTSTKIFPVRLESRYVARPSAPLATKCAGRLLSSMRARADRPPAGPDWMHVIKHDEFRIVACKPGECVQILSRHGADFTDRLARIAEAARGLSADGR